MARKNRDDDDEVVDESTSGGSIAVNDAWTGMLAISLLALMVGTGFLAYDYFQYDADKLPPVPRLTGSQPGQPVPDKAPPKIEPPKDDKKDDKKDEKQDDKKAP
jgi:hypothetical protein